MRFLPFLLLSLCLGLPAQTKPVHLAGAPNFRDIGGFATAGGKHVRSGLLYRSGQLSALTDADFAVLQPLGIRTVFDLRTDGERTAAPTTWKSQSAPQFVAVPMTFGTLPGNLPMAEMLKSLLAKVKTESDSRDMMTQGMADLAISSSKDFGRVLASLSAGSGPAIVHCTAGKDRTGLFTAILLKILGVPETDIMSDYLRSNEAMKSAAALPAGMQLPFDPRILGPLMSVEPGYLLASFTKIQSTYGSFDNYRRDGLQLTEEQTAKLRKLFLEN